MKTVAFTLYMTTLCVMWLVTNIFVALIGDMSYVEAIRNDINVLFLLILYWWPGLFVLEDYNKWLLSRGKYL